MIADRNINLELLYDFLKEVSKDLTLDISLEKMKISLKEYAEKLATKATIAYTLDDKGKIASCVIGYTHDMPDNGSYLTQAATLKEYRKKGLAEGLFKEYLEFAENSGTIKYAWLTTQKTNVSAQKLYEKIGFRKVEEQKSKLTGTEMYKYECELPR